MTSTSLTAEEILARLEAAGVTAQIWSGSNVTRIYVKATPKHPHHRDYGYVTPGVEWRAALSKLSNKVSWELQAILFP
jgi:hypothetical protein